VFLLGDIYRGEGERDRPYPRPIVTHGEWGLPALSRCQVRWPMGLACMARPLGFSSWGERRWHRALGFDRARRERERGREK
jgi:hypothetical protein